MDYSYLGATAGSTFVAQRIDQYGAIRENAAAVKATQEISPGLWARRQCSLADNHPQNVLRSRAARSTHAEFVSLLRDGIGNHSVKAGHRQTERQRTKQSRNDHRKAASCDGLRSNVLHGADSANGSVLNVLPEGNRMAGTLLMSV